MNLQSSKKPLITTMVVGIVAIGIFLAAYFFWYVPRVQAREYLEKSQPLFDIVAGQIPTIKENTFLDRNIQYHRREDAGKDAILDIEELEAALSVVRQAQKEIDQLATPKKVILLDEKVHTYFIGVERVLNLNLTDQVFYKKAIDAYGDDLDVEIDEYTEMFYSGGERTQFILQAKQVADFAEDALSRIRNLQLPETVERFSYDLRIETLEDIKKTFLRFNEHYRLSQDDLVGTEVEGITQRTEERNERIKKYGKEYITESDIAKGFRMLEEQAQELKNLYQGYE